jgi:hypothetical protein
MENESTKMYSLPILFQEQTTFPSAEAVKGRLDWCVAATELPPRGHLGLKLAGPLCAAIQFHLSSPEVLHAK